MSEHSDFQPSASHRWISCPGSWAVDRAAVKEAPNKYMMEGTAYHELADIAFKAGTNATDYVGTEIGGVEITQDNAETLQRGYISPLRNAVLHGEDKRAVFVSEHRVDFQNLVPPSYTGFGTLDVGLWFPRYGALVIADLKFGRGERVEAKDNPALMLYAWGLCRLFDISPRIIELRIYQPRINNYPVHTIDYYELAHFADKAKKAAYATQEPNAPRVPGDKQCRWCSAKADCSARAAWVGRTIAADFEAYPVVPDDVSGIPPVILGKILESAPAIRSFLNACETRAKMEIETGRRVPGWKLVKGREGDRKWTDEQATISALSLRVPGASIYTAPKLKSPTQIEQTLKKSDVKDASEIIKPLVTRAPASINLVPETDGRQAIEQNCGFKAEAKSSS